jgi:nucleotide-binding universal stress UspA family protein
LDWAAGEAAIRGAALNVIEAFSFGEFGDPKEISKYHQQKLEETVSTRLEGVDVKWDAIAQQGSAAKVLLRHAEKAQMLVVGSRGHGALAGLALGSVGIQVATHEGAPVVVVVRS